MLIPIDKASGDICFKNEIILMPFHGTVYCKMQSDNL